MKKIDKDELFVHIRQYLKTKGIELEEGSYTRTVEKGCQVLADTINLSQQALGRAKTELEKTLDQARQVIHEKTAPRKPSVQSQPPPAPASPEQKEPPKSSPGRAKTRRPSPPKTARRKPAE
jgi:hypothetical protein